MFSMPAPAMPWAACAAECTWAETIQNGIEMKWNDGKPPLDLLFPHLTLQPLSNFLPSPPPCLTACIAFFQISAVARIRHALAFATHSFFHSRGFLYVHTPIVTTNDCEGAGEMFQVRGNEVPQAKGNEVFQVRGNEMLQAKGNEVPQAKGNEVLQASGMSCSHHVG